MTYGLGNELENQVQQKANRKFKIVVEKNKNQNVEIDFNFNSQNLNLIDNIEITAMENTKSTIIIKIAN